LQCILDSVESDTLDVVSLNKRIKWAMERRASRISHSPSTPKISNVQEKSRGLFPLRLRNAKRYIDKRIALIGYDNSILLLVVFCFFFLPF